METRTYRRLKQPITPDIAYNMKPMLVHVHRLRQIIKQYQRLKTSRWSTPYRSRGRRFPGHPSRQCIEKYQRPTESLQPYISIALAPFPEPHGHEKGPYRPAGKFSTQWYRRGRLMRLDGGALGANRESWREFGGELILDCKVPNFVRLRHLLAAHLAYCQTTRHSFYTHTNHTYGKDLKAGIINNASSTAQEVQDWAQNARKAVREFFHH
jgi:hypothetical protein